MSFEPDLSDPYVAKAVELRKAFDADAVERDKAGGRPLDQIRLLKESGLLAAQISPEYGGAGASWHSLLRVVREFARTDGSLAHLFGYHHLPLNQLYFRGGPALKERLLSASAREQWFWGNSGNVMSKTLVGRPDGEYWVLNGRKPFSSGSHVADYLTIAFETEADGERQYASIPASRAGIRIEDDWDGIGQTQTGSGTVGFVDVRVHRDELHLGASVPLTPFTSLISLLQQAVLLNVFVGSAQGALDDGRTYSVSKSRPWIYSGVENHIDDPWIKRQYGDLVIRTRAAELLADKAARSFDEAWARGPELTARERGLLAIDLASANVYAGEIGLKVSSEIFEVMGARSATKANGFDRFWRNVRTHTLHNPAEYKQRTVGDWFLTGTFPEPAPYR
jgi:alkylation response protein AidB-like acyl-CoA dehydrogenase